MTIENAPQIDDYGRNLLHELQQDARLSYADLGRRVGLSPSATAERMRRMEEDGIIRAYTTEIDRESLGLPILAYIRMTCDGQRYQPFLKFVHSLNEVRECHHVTGGDAFFLQIATASIAELERTIERLLPYGIPTTSIVLSSPIVRRAYEVLMKAGRKSSHPAVPRQGDLIE
ncbi:Transcriptional regulator, AsnC family [Acidisarcina polymorpha]|uniref:Transcriptional regulator, AsnC family n=1 Tax=Acidisarcina polymorpha TaxID=2211140 RepID=A0A2Z5FYE1_9BACT|nr:Lrp/AsnC family transcriptional regulator [Acidisarcina polymorpha]AXC11832.1 Transcriptional regulator, AsnC family [Acidisarcina polymorpha]